MGRKWTNMRFEFENRDVSIVEASADPRTQEEAFREYVRERWDDDNLPGVRGVDVMFGNFSTDKIERVVGEFFEEFDFLRGAGVVFVTDSANIGYGWVFERQEDEAVCVEEFNGYEGAFGEDVAGMISEEHYINVDPGWYW